QTFGCFCREPYPALLARRLGLDVLNLGYGGAGPEFFLRHAPLQDYVNGGRFVVIQVMSGRSQSNSVFESGGLEYLTRRRDGRKLGALEAYRELLAGPALLRSIPPRPIFRRLARAAAIPAIRRVIEETRRGWVSNHRDLLNAFRVPKILLWFSKRTTSYDQSL